MRTHRPAVGRTAFIEVLILYVATCLMLQACASSPAAGQAAGPFLSEGLARPPYTALSARTSTIEQELGQAAAAGYQVVSASPINSELILRKAPETELYDYRVIHTTASDTAIYNWAVPAASLEGARQREEEQLIVTQQERDARLEREMNGAAAAGFRLVPQGIIALKPLHVLMEKRWPETEARTTYRVRSINTFYEIKEQAFKEWISGGRLDTNMVDAHLADAARDGYQVVSMVTRTLFNRRENKPAPAGVLGRLAGAVANIQTRQAREELIVFFEHGAQNTTAADFDTTRRFRVVTAPDQGAGLPQGLNGAASAGYHLLMAARHGPESIAMVERSTANEPQPTYRLLPLTRDLEQAAASGWLPSPRGVLGEAVITERRDEVGSRFEVRVLSAARLSTLARELEGAADEGFELLLTAPDLRTAVLARTPR